jgi:hypothetical protein
MRAARLVLGATLALAVTPALGCDRKGSAPGAGAGAAPSSSAAHGPRGLVPRDGGQLVACYTEAACDGRHRGDRCYFASPHDQDPQGFCAGPEPPCAVSYPFCSMKNETIWVCRFPSQPWKHKGSCEDAGPANRAR